MKKLIFLLSLLIGISAVAPVFAQKSDKALNKQLKSKATKRARDEAKTFKKQGYYVAQGALPMDMQLENAWKKQLQEDEDGYPKFIVATGNSVSESQTAAKLQATETAKLELAGTITTNVMAIIENNIATQQLSAEDAAAVTKTVGASKNIIAQELGRVVTLYEMYRKVGNNIEANVRLAYDSKTAKDAAKKVIRKKLEEEAGLVQEKLDKLMNF
ncbi:MAG: hypothetical protein KGZ82_00500 [Bacteroidales bacterium]|nr:hypothetical protein [Bacteroidales bacterium]